MLIIELVFLVYFVPLVAFNFIFGVASVFPLKKKTTRLSCDKAKIAVLIPGYKEDSVILSVAKKALDQSYDTDAFDVVIIADSFLEQTLLQLKTMPIRVIEVVFEKSTKAKALNKAMSILGDRYDIAVLLDADNVMEYDFLTKVNNAYQAGYVNLQGRRVAKNTDSDFSVLDGISEAINNNIFRKGHNILGFSCSFIGSGMALPYASFKEKMGRIDAVGGFDRALQVEFIGDGEKIWYLNDALVYDEKIGSSAGFGNQRKRWLSSQFVYLSRNLKKGFLGLLSGKFDLFNASILHNLFLPRVLNLGLLFVYVVIYFLLHRYLEIDFWIVFALFALYYFATLVAIPRHYFSWKMILALMTLPQAFFIMFASLFKLRGANKTFIHTEHTSADVDEKPTS